MITKEILVNEAKKQLQEGTLSQEQYQKTIENIEKIPTVYCEEHDGLWRFFCPFCNFEFCIMDYFCVF